MVPRINGSYNDVVNTGSGKSIGFEKKNSSLPYFSINCFDVTLAENVFSYKVFL